MNQIKKRLTIIKLAISMTDMETIQLQMLKLTPIKTDAAIQKILSLLQAGNYAQAQVLITEYIDFAPQEVVQRSDQISPEDSLFSDIENELEQHTPKEASTISPEEQAIIDEFQLIIDSNHQNNPVDAVEYDTEIAINDFAPLKKLTQTKEEDHSINFDSLLNIEAKDVLNIASNLEDTPDIDKEEIEKETIKEREDIPQEDTFFHTIEEAIHKEEEQDEIEEITLCTDNTLDEEILHYHAIEDVLQKFTDLQERYPPIQKMEEQPKSVDTLLETISTEGYSEEMIEHVLDDIQNLIQEGHYGEAAQLLLVCGTTESKYAQFLLARELYRGALLRKNIPASFTLIQELAIDNYPEALCDLGQFYEHGIGTTPNLTKAEKLYKEAMDLGIKRAKKHFNRLHKTKKSFFKKIR